MNQTWEETLDTPDYQKKLVEIRKETGMSSNQFGKVLDLFVSELSLARLEGEKAERERILKELDQVERTAWRDANHCACLRFAIHKIEDPEVEALEQEDVNKKPINFTSDKEM